MGAGRKTTTYDVDTSYQASLQSFNERQRNLGTQLYGVIFGKQALLQNDLMGFAHSARGFVCTSALLPTLKVRLAAPVLCSACASQVCGRF